ncbi:MAG: cob(I)yrinic acid a,c-diamide adenosyltransferase [Proteobacteria bacterium]|nr:cob(I)yrinic acid a,c-diamide adenosyltransferase [Pseudomonadota bacterium]
MKLYTGRGDDGNAGLLSGERVPKSHERIDALGDIDELGSALGIFRAGLTRETQAAGRHIRRIQSDLMNIGACLSAWRDAPILDRLKKINEADIQFLETSIDSIQELLPELKGFVLPGGHPSEAWAHFARSVCRRAERKIAALSIELKVGRPPKQIKPILVYLNRLSDYLFVLGRYCNHLENIPDDIWKI